MSVYLDYNASTPIDERVLDYMIDVYRNSYGNSDSRTHDYGDRARQIVENARKQVGELLGCSSSEVFFTSGATESTNIAILGLHDYAVAEAKKHIVTTAIEHKATLGATEKLAKMGFDVEFITPRNDGCVDAEDIINSVREDTLLVSVMHANNETGSIQPVDIIGEELEKRNVLFHVDATQSCGKLVDELRQVNYDMLSLSAHKMYGPQGVGALVLKRRKHKLPPVKAIMFGGQQEHGIRPGTVPVALVAGLGKASEIAIGEHKENLEKCKLIKKDLLRSLELSGLDFSINGTVNSTMPNTLNICIKGIASEALMIATKQFCGVSNGSACTSKDYAASYVLKAMGLSDEDANSSIRISWSAKQDGEEIVKNFEQLLSVAKNMV